MAIKALSAQEVEAELAKAPSWRLEGKEITRTFAFKGFEDSIRFVNQAALEAERADHHPDILIQYNKVTLRLSTHDAGGLSTRDFTYAKAADALFSRF